MNNKLTPKEQENLKRLLELFKTNPELVSDGTIYTGNSINKSQLIILRDLLYKKGDNSYAKKVEIKLKSYEENDYGRD